MIKIYFDDVLIDEDKYSELTNDYQILDDNFMLGSTSSDSYILSLYVDDLIIPNEVKIYDDDTLISTLYIDDYKHTDDKYTLILKDKFVKMNESYNLKQLLEKLGRDYATLIEIVQDICDKYELELGTTDFNGNDKQISWYDDTLHTREIISFVAELNSGFARIENNTLYFIKQKMNSKASILKDDCSDFSIGDKHKITGVIYAIGTDIWQRGDDSGSVIYINPDNIFITDESDIAKIYNDIKDLEFYSFDPQDCPILDYDIKAGDIITFVDDENELSIPIIANISKKYFGNWYGRYYLKINSVIQDATQVKDTKSNIRSIKTRLNRDEARLDIIAEQSDEATEKVADLSIEVEKIAAKVETIADVMIRGETIKYLELENLIATYLGKLHVKANISTINDTYLKTGLQEAIKNDNDELIIRHPWSTGDYLTSKRIKIKVNKYITYFELPILWHYDDTHYDEYIYDYVEKKITIIHRVKAEKTTIDNLEVYYITPLIKEVIEEIKITDETAFLLPEDGNYSFELLTGPNYMSITAMVKNDYTSQFATKVELKSGLSITSEEIKSTVEKNYATKNELNTEITQRADSIELLAREKVGNNEIISKINQTPEQITINANKLNLQGYVTVSDLSGTGKTTINGSNITTGTIDATKVNVTNVVAKSVAAENITGTTISGKTINGGTVSGATITGGSITLSGSSETAAATVFRINSSNRPGDYVRITGSTFYMVDSGDIVRASLTDLLSSTVLQLVARDGQTSTMYTSSGVMNSSDITLKENIKEINEEISLNIINNLTPIEYTYKNDDTFHRGLSAQEVEEVLRNNNIKNEIYSINEENGNYMLNYIEFIPDLINCIKYQQKQIDELKEEIKRLKVK
jgi:hypothetical protein